MSTRTQALRVPGALADPAWRRLLMTVAALVVVAVAIGLLTMGRGPSSVPAKDTTPAQHQVQVGGDGPLQYKVLP